MITSSAVSCTRRASVEISSRRGCNPAGPRTRVQGTQSSLAPWSSVWQPSGRAARRSPPLWVIISEAVPGPGGARVLSLRLTS